MPKSIKKAMILLPIIVKSKVGIARDKILSKVRKALSESYSKEMIDGKTHKSWNMKIQVSNGNCRHIADDILSNKVIGKRRIYKLDILFKESKFYKDSGLYKNRKDTRTHFYYFKHPNENLYFHVSKNYKLQSNGRKKYFYELYSITKELPPEVQ